MENKDDRLQCVTEVKNAAQPKSLMEKLQLILVLSLFTGLYLSAAWLDNYPVTVTQPDETALHLIAAEWGLPIQCLNLYSTGVSSDGFISLEYQWISPPPSTETYGYTLFQWDDAVEWQSTSTNYDKTIQVLNVYPDLNESNTLAAWMHDPAVGLGKIVVTPVSISEFNSNPDSYLKDSSGQYQYDAMMFGSWDANNVRDLTPISATAVRNFLNSGRGVLFGHDTQFNSNQNFSLLKEKTNLEYGENFPRGSTNIQAVNDGFLLKYPHTIPYNSILTIPETHSSSGQFAKGVIWMIFPNTFGSVYDAPEVWFNGGTNNFYLTTWNNAAIIQTGHSNGESTLDERKVIANTLWYLSQLTTETAVKVYTAPDLAAPDEPTVSQQCNQIGIVSKDNGSLNSFYVKATNMVNDSDTCKSNIVEVMYKTGLKGFYILEDNNATSVLDLSSNFTTFIPAADNQWVTYTAEYLTNYIHIQAVDAAGNLSAVRNLNPLGPYNVSVSAIPPEGGAVIGNDTYSCDDIAIVKAIPNEGYNFVSWTENGIEVSTDAVYSFTVTGDRTLVASFNLDFDTYAVIICDRVILLNLRKLAEDGYEVTGCKWYKNGIEITETNTNDMFSYAEGADNLLEIAPANYTFCLITQNHGVLCSTEKLIISRNKALDCDECDEENSDNLLIYPNPLLSGNLLTLEGVVKGSPVYVYNHLGACAFSAIATDNIMKFTLDLPQGIYLIRNEDKIVKVVIVR